MLLYTNGMSKHFVTLEFLKITDCLHLALAYGNEIYFVEI